MRVPRRGIALACFAVASALFLAVLVPPAHAQADGALYFSPSSGHEEVGDTFSVSVRVNTSGDAINAAEGSIVFDTAKLEVTSVSTTGSIFTLWPASPAFSNSDGTVSFTGGLPSPGYSGANGQIVTINFRAKAATTVKGYTDVVLVSGAILANDGNGTNILQSLGKATFFIEPKGIQPTSTPIPGTATLGAPVISSSTHPDQTKWYSNSDPTFSWDVPAGVTEVRLVLATHSNSVPSVRYSPPINQKALTNVADGTWYFRAQFRNASGLGAIGTFPFNVDTHPPEPFTISRVDTADPTNPQPQLVFSATDTMSGIDHYEMQIGDGDWVNVTKDQAGQEYALPTQLPGTRQVTVKAVDLAGNATTATISMTVAPIMAPTITEFPSDATSDTPLAFSGRGVPGNHILLFANSNQIGQGDVDMNGDWHIQSISMNPGTFTCTAYAQDSRGARSDPSNAVTVSVRSNVAQKLLNFIVRLATGISQTGTWWFVISLIFYIILIFLFLQGCWWLIMLLRRKKKKQKTTNAPGLTKQDLAFIKKLRSMDVDIEKELALLRRVAKHRSLYPEERYLVSKLSQYRKILRSISLGKE